MPELSFLITTEVHYHMYDTTKENLKLAKHNIQACFLD